MIVLFQKKPKKALGFNDSDKLTLRSLSSAQRKRYFGKMKLKGYRHFYVVEGELTQFQKNEIMLLKLQTDHKLTIIENIDPTEVRLLLTYAREYNALSKEAATDEAGAFRTRNEAAELYRVANENFWEVLRARTAKAKLLSDCFTNALKRT